MRRVLLPLLPVFLAALLPVAAGQTDRPNEAQLHAIRDAATLRPLPEPTRLTSAREDTRLELALPVNSVALLVVGQEPRRTWAPGPHVHRVLAAAAAGGLSLEIAEFRARPAP